MVTISENQQETLNWFRNQYLSGNTCFISLKQVCDSIKDRNQKGVRRDVIKLYAWGYLEIRVIKGWFRTYRIRKKYLSINEVPVSPLRKEDYRENDD